MEHELGFSVIDQSRPRVSLTAAGATFIESAQAIVDAHDQGMTRDRATQNSSKPLRVAGIAAGTSQFSAISSIEVSSFELVGTGANLSFFEMLLNGEADIEASVARLPLGDDLHACGLGATRAYYAGRDDVVIYTEIERQPLQFPTFLAWRANPHDSRREALAERIAKILAEM